MSCFLRLVITDFSKEKIIFRRNLKFDKQKLCRFWVLAEIVVFVSSTSSLSGHAVPSGGAFHSGALFAASRASRGPLRWSACRGRRPLPRTRSGLRREFARSQKPAWFWLYRNECTQLCCSVSWMLKQWSQISLHNIAESRIQNPCVRLNYI